MLGLLNFLQSPIGLRCSFFLITLFGATAMYVFSLQKGFKGAGLFLRRFFPGKSEIFYDRMDFLLVVMFGSVIGTIFFWPGSAIAALAAGFGWVGATNTLLSAHHPAGSRAPGLHQ
jgi:hypothetical protein